MKKFNEWLETVEAVQTELTAVGNSNAVNTNVAGVGNTNVTASAGLETPSDALEKGDVASYLRLIQRITGEQVYDPKLVQALRRVIAIAPQEMTSFLQILGSMTIGQQGRANKGVASLTGR